MQRNKFFFYDTEAPCGYTPQGASTLGQARNVIITTVKYNGGYNYIAQKTGQYKQRVNRLLMSALNSTLCF